MLKTFVLYLYTLIGLVASLITIWLFTKNVYPKFTSDARVAALFLGLFGVYYFIETLILKLRWGRSEKYRQATSLIFDGLSEIQALPLQDPNNEKIVSAIKRLCDYLASAFTLITGTNCSVTIKLVEKGTDEISLSRLKVETLCRDDRSKELREKADTVDHWVEGSTAFNNIFDNIHSPSERYFHSNQLPFRYGYRNTSFQAYGSPENREISILLLPLRPFFRNWRWPLPYKSALIVPIIDFADPVNLLGFLCVDSPSLGAFKVDNDKELLVSVADALSYPVSLLLVD